VRRGAGHRRHGGVQLHGRRRVLVLHLLRRPDRGGLCLRGRHVRGHQPARLRAGPGMEEGVSDMAVTLTKPVKYDQVMGHFHIGSIMPGYLPEREVVCAVNLANAIEYLVDELDLSQDQLMDPDGDDADEYGRIESV